MLGKIDRLIRKLKLRYGSQDTVIQTLREMGVQVGDRCRIYTTQFGGEPYLIRIGNHVGISNDVTFVTHNLNWVFQDKYESLTSFGKIEIKDNCNIGVGVIILPNVTIGPNSVVGAGSVVTKDVPPNSVAAGNPAKVICSVDDYEKKVVANHIPIPLDREEARKTLIKRFWGEDA
ncbi:MAG: acyltransferase [Candidatus Hydrogenedentales bacterium]|jgi:acetyltransferase-like isoleucine patch superfamily enzyme